MLRFSITLCLLFSSQLFGFTVGKHANLSSFQTFKHSIQKTIETHLNIHIPIDDDISNQITSEFQELLDQGPIPVLERTFVIQGWRWHTKSVLYDLERFQKLINKLRVEYITHISHESATMSSLDLNNLQKQKDDKLERGFNFVFNFNFKALMRVEREIFFPWLADILPSSSKPLVEGIINKHSKINELTERLRGLCTTCSALDDNMNDMQAILAELKQSTRDIQNIQVSYHITITITHDILNYCIIYVLHMLQENYLVPFVSAYISKREQGKFNRKVLSNLGLLNSQVT